MSASAVAPVAETETSRRGSDQPAAEVAAWLDALASVVLIPPGFREKALSREQAVIWLGCRAEVFDAVVAAGLPEAEPDRLTGAPRYDFHDVTNIGLRVGTGCTTAELGERAVLRWATAAPASWVSPRPWAVELHYQCGHGTDCLHGDWRIAESAAAAFGGRVDSFDVEKDGPGLTVRLEATLVGAVRPVVSSRIADAFGHVLAGFRTEQVRYQWLPDGLRRDPTAARSLGIADCVVTSVELAKMLGDAGFDTRTRTVTALGVVGIDHAWTEVLDDDGEWKVLDPVFAYLAVRRPGGRPEFEEFCRGSHGNRSLAWQSGAIEGVADHHCAGPASSIESSITAGAIRHA